MRIRLTAIILLLCLCPTGIAAQEFFNLTANDVRVDSLLPVFTHSVDLGTAYADSVYEVSIDYPEFIDMSPADTLRCHCLLNGQTVGEMPHVETNIGVARRRGQLDISFSPIVRRQGHYQKLVSFMLRIKASPRHTQQPSPATQHPSLATTRADDGDQRYHTESVLREGTWAKIRVPATGVYQLTDELLRKAGFSDPQKVSLFGYGGALQPEKLTADYLMQTDDLQEVPTCTIGGRRLFHAVGPVTWETATSVTRTRNFYSDYGYYFLTDTGNTPQSVDEQTFIASFYPSADDYHHLYEVDNYAPYEGGRLLVEQTAMSAGGAYSYTIASHTTTATLALQMNYDYYFDAEVSVNGTTVGNAVVSTAAISEARLQDNPIAFPGEYDTGAYHTWTFTVDNLVVGNNTIRISLSSGSNVRLDFISLTATEPASKPDLSSAQIPVPEYVCNITNQNHHADTAVDMVIIIPTSQKWLSQAERLKTMHEQMDGMSVRIVPADELYNEFASGTPDATAYRRYMKMLYDRATDDSQLPQYLLLFGDALWDNRLVTAAGRTLSADDLLLCYESENSNSHINCYVSDDFFCLLDDEEQIQQYRSASTLTYLGKPDVAVGRLPARTLEQARILTDKTIDYRQNKYAADWQNTICIMGDDGNNNSHMRTAEKVAKQVQTAHPAYSIKKIYWDSYKRVTTSTGYSYPEVTTLLRQQLSNGALIMNYSGHGAPYTLSHEMVVSLNDFQIDAAGRLPLWLTASCEIMPFDSSEDNIGETAMTNPTGGAIAFFGTTRTVYSNYNESMNLAFMKYVLDSTDGKPNTIGEAARMAKCYLVTSGSDTTPNKLQYSLLGDPAIALAKPEEKVVIDSINGQPSTQAQQLLAASVVTMSGHVERLGTTLSDYNGTVTATVYDAEQQLTGRLNDTSAEGSQTAFTYSDHVNTIYHGQDSVRQGHFKMNFAVPKDINYSDGTGLITLYTIDNQKQTVLHGQLSNFTVSGSTTTASDMIGPSIYCYLNSPDFNNGGTVNTTPFFVAQLYDDNGINVSGSGIGHDLELCIDGKAQLTYNLNDYFTYDFGDYRSGTVGYSIPALDEGEHKLTFRAWDILNNSSQTELDFRVSQTAQAKIVSVAPTRNPAYTQTTFLINHNRPGSLINVTLDIFDTSGRHLWQHSEQGTSEGTTYTIDWDLTTDSGRRLQTGVYLYRVTISCDGSNQTSKAGKLIIVNR